MSITLQYLQKSFSGKPAVDGVTLDIMQGEFFAIVGASGCGKSTLLRLIAGLETADAGEIHLGGRQVSGPGLHVPPEARGTGFVFQSYALWPHLDVRGNVAFPAEAAGLGRAEAAARAERHLATVELSDFAGRKPADLSGGQRQRVALARCLAQEARVILMDEPLANLDPHLRATMEEELSTFHRASGATTVYITHDQREAMAVADRMAVMAEGRFLQVGTPSEIYDRPASAAVARFIGQGAIQPVLIRGGVAELAGQPVRLRGAEGPDGAREALFRPADLAVGASGDGLPARVLSALYRGGLWEAKLAVEGLPAPCVVHLPGPVRAGEALGLRVLGGWVLPG
ncbi:ABC transporter ATP-binding protein [Roseicyclus mahoneyensis]|uniref:Carbohydrate ABC transporter ATP-binding protein (CUT1 family) n=1 Tax=Roseicyclus mahoneyensis TaxID=164332 RepID=A0A316GBJ3_9RHOB|nr:ABC transporter ATP-binding protein [Roseicyclus mahoneyensis]PWK57953.1 carbohydrate ABC transporter ATP-binding protein (CUT1 family) [Roseicyclus mahoneyensis]